LRLDIGCGRGVEPGFTGLDINPGPAVSIVADIFDRDAVLKAIPENSVEEMRMSHVLEHFHGRDALFILETLHMIAVDGCKIEVRVPYGQSNDHWRDPDHKRPYLWDGFNCFSAPYWGSYNTGNTNAFGYGADWKPLEALLVPVNHEVKALVKLGSERWWYERGLVLWNCIRELRMTMVAVKPSRAHDESLSEDFSIKIKVVNDQ
jgi:hypothetical protein